MVDIDVLLDLYKAKFIKRKGWIDFGIDNAESIADHSFLLAMLAYILGKEKGLDIDKLVKMALFHDVAEVKTGDLTPRDVERELKLELEKKAFLEMFGQNSEIFKLWNEFEKRESEEAKFLAELDKLERIIQAFIYERRYNTRLDEFWKEDIKDEVIKKIVEELKKRRLSNF